MAHKILKAAINYKTIELLTRKGLGSGVKITRANPIRGGLFNTSYKVEMADERAVVLRIAPPRDKKLLSVEKQLLKREVYVNKCLKGTEIPVPKLLFSDFSRKMIDRDYIISEFVEGYSAFYHQKYLAKQEMDHIYRELGDYARRIHSLENKEQWFGYPPPFARDKKWSDFIAQYVRSLEEDLNRHPYLSLPKEYSLSDITKKLVPQLDKVKTPRLIHGDLWLRNILIRKEHGCYKISAILDWDRALWGDPYFEWILYGTDPNPSFWKAYGKTMPAISEAAYVRVLLYKSCGAIQAALEDSIHFGLKKNSLTMFGYALKDLRELSKNLIRTDYR
ncbi:MAG: aminoglycoside phosphotransferase family protein [bacterium]|nr:aminoglycoside phosphotransferase family protein [bacterium]MDD5756899.1 aminoglycoside phosphotransferase family protein [bacterium]